MDELLRNAQDAISQLPGGAAWIAAGVLLILAAGYVAWRLFRRRKPLAARGAPQLVIDISTLGDQGPPPGPAVLEFYNIPVRVAAIALAPAGRIRDLPPPSELPKLFDAIVPGLDVVIAAHQPLVRRWPNQVSARGFAHTVFANVRLPGDGGKGTPWSAMAGIIKLEGQPVMVGLVLRAGRPNSFGQVAVDSEEKWLGCLRVRETNG